MTDEHWALLRIFQSCDRGLSGCVYPDGGAVLDQPILLLQAFNVIASAIAKRKHDDD